MFKIESEREEDGRWIAEVPALPGVISYGATEAEARAKLTGAYDKFMAQGDPVRKSEAGADLIRAIFGRDAIAEDPLR